MSHSKLFKGAWKRLQVGAARSGPAAFQHERRVDRAMWRWRGKQGKLGWVWGDRFGYRMGVLRRQHVRHG